jgi:hypothetical protein
MPTIQQLRNLKEELPQLHIRYFLKNVALQLHISTCTKINAEVKNKKKLLHLRLWIFKLDFQLDPGSVPLGCEIIY